MKLEISFWKKFIFSHFCNRNSIDYNECFEQSQEIIDYFLEDQSKLLLLWKNEAKHAKNMNKTILKNVIDIRGRSDKKLKIKH